MGSSKQDPVGDMLLLTIDNNKAAGSWPSARKDASGTLSRVSRAASCCHTGRASHATVLSRMRWRDRAQVVSEFFACSCPRPWLFKHAPVAAQVDGGILALLATEDTGA